MSEQNQEFDKAEIDKQAVSNVARSESKLVWLKKFYTEDSVDLIESPDNKKVKLTKLFKAADRIVAAVGQDCACSKRCSHCCHQAVTISEEEAKRISQSTGKVYTKGGVPIGEELAEKIHLDRTAYATKACPFLKNNLCSIYTVRPVVCRLNINLSDTPELCDTVTNPKQEVPLFNPVPFIFRVAQALGENQKYADIRAFFPSK